MHKKKYCSNVHKTKYPHQMYMNRQSAEINTIIVNKTEKQTMLCLLFKNNVHETSNEKKIIYHHQA